MQSTREKPFLFEDGGSRCLTLKSNGTATAASILELKSLPFDDCAEHHWPATIETGPAGWRLLTQWLRGG
jgi:hypothetical protein